MASKAFTSKSILGERPGNAEALKTNEKDVLWKPVA